MTFRELLETRKSERDRSVSESPLTEAFKRMRMEPETADKKGEGKQEAERGEEEEEEWSGAETEKGEEAAEPPEEVAEGSETVSGEFVVVQPKRSRRGGKRHKKSSASAAAPPSMASDIKSAIQQGRAQGKTVEQAKREWLAMLNANPGAVTAPAAPGEETAPRGEADAVGDSDEDKVTNMSKRSSTRSSCPPKKINNLVTKPCYVPLL
jgi:hypothetical protein